jgi:lysophospholipase L1-like esterase
MHVGAAGPMNYQNLLCLGDSQTFGARSYGCYPLYLAKVLTESTPYIWRVINRGVNRFRVRDLWFLANSELDSIQDTFQVCVLIGANDVGDETPTALFAEYYRQILHTLIIRGYKALFCGEIPPIFPDGHIFFSQATRDRREQFNVVIEQLLVDFPQARLVRFSTLTRADYEDPVHFNESGNQKVAQAFAESILKR